MHYFEPLLVPAATGVIIDILSVLPFNNIHHTPSLGHESGTRGSEFTIKARQSDIWLPACFVCGLVADSTDEETRSFH